MHESKPLNESSVARPKWAQRREIHAQHACGGGSESAARAPSVVEGQSELSRQFQKLHVIAQSLQLPYWRLEELEAHCHAARPDDPIALLQQRTLKLFTEQLHSINCAYNRQRRLRRNELTDGRTVYQHDHKNEQGDLSVPPEPIVRMPEKVDSLPPAATADIRRMLLRHVNVPLHRGLSDGSCGTADDSLSGNVVTISLEAPGGVIDAVGYQASGNSLLDGCASFILAAVLGEGLAWASCVRVNALAYVLRLDVHEKLCAQLVVSALRAAVKKAVHRLAEQKPKARGGAPRGHRRPRQAADGEPTLTTRDRALLRPAEKPAELLRERGQIVGVIENLDECLELSDVVNSFDARTTSKRVTDRYPGPTRKPDYSSQQKQREDLRCMAMSVLAALASLPEDGQQLVELMRKDGRTQEEVATMLGVTQATVHNRLWAVACQIQAMWRKPCKERPENSGEQC